MHCPTCTCESKRKAPRKRGITRTEGPYECKVGCGCTPLKHYDSLRQHLKVFHNLTVGQYMAEHGIPEPMTKAEQEAYVAEAKCHLCPKIYSSDLGHRYPLSALNSHMWGHHQLKRFGTEWLPR